MTQRTFITLFDEDGEVQALVQSMPRSFKMHVWANRLIISEESTTELEYIGTIQPNDPTDSWEIHLLARDAWLKYQKKSNTEQE